MSDTIFAEVVVVVVVVVVAQDLRALHLIVVIVDEIDVGETLVASSAARLFHSVR